MNTESAQSYKQKYQSKIMKSTLRTIGTKMKSKPSKSMSHGSHKVVKGSRKITASKVTKSMSRSRPSTMFKKNMSK